MLSLDAETGEFRAFFQVPKESDYRPSDGDIDVGGGPVIFKLKNQKVVGIACKNGGFFVRDADTFGKISWRQLLPYQKDGKTQIETVDAHPNPADGSINPHISNELSNQTPNENYSGVFNTGAVYPGSAEGTVSQRIFFGMGGPNYHSAAPG